MSKVHYRFNSKTLAVEKVKPTFLDKLKSLFRLTLSGLIVSLVVLFIGFTFFETPKERMLKREVENFRVQHEVINDRLDMLGTVLDDIQERDDQIYRVIFEADPIPRTVRDAAFGGTDRYMRLSGFNNSKMISQTMQRIDQLASKLYIQSKSYDEVFSMAVNKADMLASIPAIIPIPRAPTVSHRGMA